jgi:maleylacetate reductase
MTLPETPRRFRAVVHAQDIRFGDGALAELAAAVAEAGWRRLMLCTTRSMRRAGHAAAVETLLGDRLAAVYDRTDPHVQDSQVDEALALALAAGVEAVIGLGGGSAVGLAKAVAAELGARRGGQVPPVVAVPATYAGSEMTAVYGVTRTRETPPRKVTTTNPAVVPRLVIYDPDLTLDLPPDLTAGTGINALAHCLEALYSPQRHPLSTAAALQGTAIIYRALPRAWADGQDRPARAEMLLGAYLAGLSLAGGGMGLHHGLCHVLGGTAGVPHGVANAVILPHALRFNAATVGPLLLPAAEAMGLPADPADPTAAVMAMAVAVAELAARMGLPGRLRDAGPALSDIPLLAQLAAENPTVGNNPRPASAAELERLLREAW